jgi:hypothetical protein
MIIITQSDPISIDRFGEAPMADKPIAVVTGVMGAIVLARDRRRTTIRRHSCIRTADTAPSIHRRIGRDQLI